MADFWITANYAENKAKHSLIIGAPKHLRYESIDKVIDYLLSNEARSVIKEHEIKIVGYISRCMEEHRHVVAGGRVNSILLVYLQNKEGGWVEHGDENNMPNLSEAVTPYLIPKAIKVGEEEIKVDVLHMLFEQVPFV